MFYLTTHSTHVIYGYMASDIWLRTMILIVREETRCRHIGYSFWLAARVLLYAPSHRQDSTYHGLCYTSCGTLAETRCSSMGAPHEGSIWRPIAQWECVFSWCSESLDRSHLGNHWAISLLCPCMRQPSQWFPFSASAPHFTRCYVLSCLWGGAYKRYLAASQKE